MVELGEPTEYWEDFLQYYQWARHLQNRNLGHHHEDVPCPLMNTVPIYDTIDRRYAGFSKVLEHLHGRRKPELAQRQGLNYRGDYSFDLTTWNYLHLVHRITGSGASFEPDHGYRNTIVFELADLGEIKDISTKLKEWDAGGTKKIFTSIGNQIPPFNKPGEGFTRGGFEYLSLDAPLLARDYSHWLIDNYEDGNRIGIKQAVDWVLNWQSSHGMKRYAFVLTAFCMDTAEYFPHLVDPKSHCYYGKNAFETMDMLFKAKHGKSKHYDLVVEHICNLFGSIPYSVEDVLCDYIRWVENYVPKSYRHLEPEKLMNASKIQHHHKRFSHGWNPHAPR